MERGLKVFNETALCAHRMITRYVQENQNMRALTSRRSGDKRMGHDLADLLIQL